MNKLNLIRWITIIVLFVVGFGAFLYTKKPDILK